MSGNEENIKQNIDNIIQLSLKGEGPLTEYFARIREGIEKKIVDADKFKTKQKTGGQPLSQEQIDQQVREQLNATIASKVKPAMEKAAKGETGDAGIEEIAGLASMASNIGSGGILGLITSIPALISNSIVGDYVKAGISYFFGGENKPKSFSEALEQVRFERGMDELAKGVGVDAAELKAAMLADPAENKARLVEMNRVEQEAAAARAAAAAAQAAAPPPSDTEEEIAVKVPGVGGNRSLRAADGALQIPVAEVQTTGTVAPPAPDQSKKEESTPAPEASARAGGQTTPAAGSGTPAPTAGSGQSGQPPEAGDKRTTMESLDPKATGVRTPEAPDQAQQLANVPLASVVVGLQRYTEEMATFANRARDYFDRAFYQANGTLPEDKATNGNTKGGPARSGPDLLA